MKLTRLQFLGSLLGIKPAVDAVADIKPALPVPPPDPPEQVYPGETHEFTGDMRRDIYSGEYYTVVRAKDCGGNEL